MLTRHQAIEGCLLGTAAGDMLGLPYENLSRRQVAKLASLPLEQSLFCKRGMISDDTEHTVILAHSLLKSGMDTDAFAQQLSSRLRWWLLTLPPGIGSATARSLLKSWLGFSPENSGVCSAGNGPAMRTALLGILLYDHPEKLTVFVRASTRLTHTDPKAYTGALAVACAAGCSWALGVAPSDKRLEAFITHYTEHLQCSGDAMAIQHGRLLIKTLEAAYDRGESVSAFAASLGCSKGVSGYMLHTVPVALYAWLCHAEDFRQAVTEVILCGGDTDSVAAITGALVGSGLGAEAIPADWLCRHLEPPHMLSMLRRLASALTNWPLQAEAAVSQSTVLPPFPFALIRNMLMLVIVFYVWGRRSMLSLVRK